VDAEAVFHITDPHWIEIVVWSCTASSLFVADVVLQTQEMLRMRPRAIDAYGRGACTRISVDRVITRAR
jgi:hypothetical protein